MKTSFKRINATLLARNIYSCITIYQKVSLFSHSKLKLKEEKEKRGLINRIRF